MSSSIAPPSCAIANISLALHYEKDERILATGGTFEEFQAAAIASWENAPLGEGASPESCKTVPVAA